MDVPNKSLPLRQIQGARISRALLYLPEREGENPYPEGIRFDYRAG